MGKENRFSGNKRKRKLWLLRKTLQTEQSTFIPHWRDLGDYILPRRIRFNVTDSNKGDRRNLKIIDSTGSMASRTLRSGMMAGVTSPARPWFELGTDDNSLMESGPVKVWLDIVTRTLRTLFLKSNLYGELPTLYGDIGTFATGAMLMEEDFDKTFRFYTFPIGSYKIFLDDKLRPAGFFREFRLTVEQVVQKFGKVGEDGKIDFSNISDQVKNLYENGDDQQWIEINHFILMNDNYNPNKIESKYKLFASLYFESGRVGQSDSYHLTELDEGKFLSEKGYDYFPILAPRWETSGEDVYGTECPGMIALGDIKALQTMQKRKAQAIEKMVNPPTQAPTSMKQSRPTLLPGDVNYLDVREGQQGMRPVHEVDPRIKEILLDIQDHQQRIKRAFFEDLFLMISQTDRREITAREIEERHEEKLLALGPVLEQLNQDLLDPLIENAFRIAYEQGKFPEPPEELQGVDLKVEYVSIMAQAQKLAGIANVERFASFVINTSAQSGNIEMLDKVDFDQMIDNYGERTGIDQEIIRTDEDVALIRDRRAKAQQQAAILENMNQAADTAQKLSKADLEGNNALKRVTQGA